MFFYLLCLIGLCVIIYNIYNCWNYDDKVSTGLGAFLVSAFFIGLISVVVSLIYSVEADHTSKIIAHKSIPIVSLRTTQETAGSFFLGCGGGVGSNEKYYFMYKVESNSYKRGSEYTSNVTITESETEAPSWSCDIVLLEPKHTIWWPSCFLMEFSRTENIVLTVPKNTVVQNFQVDQGVRWK